MRNILFLFTLLFSSFAFAQSSPNFTKGQVPTAEQWNSYFSAKQDYKGNPLPILNGGTGSTNANAALSALGGLSSALPDGKIFIGSGSDIATPRTMSGDCSLSNAGVISCPSPIFNVKAAPFNAVCDGVTNDAAAFNAANTAVAAAGGGQIYVPLNCGIGSTVTVGAGVTFVGPGSLAPPAPGAAMPSASVKVLANNLKVFSLAGNGSGLQNIAIDAFGRTNTSGCAVSVEGSSSQALVQGVQVNAAFLAFCTAGVQPTIQRNYAFNPVSSTGGCYSITAGESAYLYYNWCRGVSAGSQPLFGISITGGGGHQIIGNQSVYPGTYGIRIDSTGTTIPWVAMAYNAMDSGTGTGLYVVSGTSGTTQGLLSVGDWFASFAGPGVLFSQGAGTISGAKIVAARIYNNGTTGVVVGASTGVAIQDSSICGNSTASPGIDHGVAITTNSATSITIEGNKIGDCDGQGATQGYGAAVNTTGAVSIVGNMFSGNATGPAVLLAQPSPFVLGNNLGIDNVIGSVASATSTALPLNPVVKITGTTSIENLTGGWSGRQVTLIPTDGLLFVTGGNIASAVTGTINLNNLFAFDGATWFGK